MNWPEENLEHDSSRWRAADLVAILILTTLWVVFFSDFLFSSKNFYFRDILNFHYPLRRVLIDAYARGEFPLWNPYLYLGQPLLANPNYMAFYPSNLLHLIFSFDYAFKLHFILHPLLATWGTFFLQRRLGLHPYAAFAGALAYGFSGTLLSFLNLYNIIPAVALMPWAGWALWGALERPTWKRIVLLAAVVALQAIAFEPLMFQCTILFLLALALYRWSRSGTSAGTLARVVSFGALLSVGFAAVQVLPTLELIPHSARGAGYDFETISGWSMHPMDLVNVVVPQFFGDPYTLNGAKYWGELFHNAREPYLVSFYLGATAILLFCMSFLTHRKGLHFTLVALTVVGVALGLGKYNMFYQWLYENVPTFGLGRYPSKYFLLATLSFSILCALGLEVLLEHEKGGRSRRRWITSISLGASIVSVGVVAVAGFFFLSPTGLDQWLHAQTDPALFGMKDWGAIRSQLVYSLCYSGGFLLLSSLLVFSTPYWRRARMIAALVILVIGAELLPSNLRLSPLISGADFSFVSEVNQFIENTGPEEPFRVASPTLLRPMPDMHIRVPNESTAWLILFYKMSGQPMYGIEQRIQYSLDRSVDHLNTRESEELWRACGRLPDQGRLDLLGKVNSPMVLLLDKLDKPGLRLISTFDTRSDFPLNLYWLEDSLARAYFVTGVRLASSAQEALNLIVYPDFPYGDTVVLEPESSVLAKEGGGTLGSARTTAYENGRVVCEVTAREPGYLVLLDSYYPGWKAYVDDEEVEILKANYAFRAVAVPPGQHQVEFRYEPNSFYLGLGISITTLMISLVVVFRGRRRDLVFVSD